MAELSKLDELKILAREVGENAVQYFSDTELEYYLTKNSGNVNAAAYQCLITKAEDTSLSVSGLSTADTSRYFLRLAQRYRPAQTSVK